MESAWLMRCYYCGVTITPPEGYGEDAAPEAPAGIEVCYCAGGGGSGRVEYVLVICLPCHHMLRRAEWFPAEDGPGADAWRPLVPMAPLDSYALAPGSWLSRPPYQYSGATRSAVHKPHPRRKGLFRALGSPGWDRVKSARARSARTPIGPSWFYVVALGCLLGMVTTGLVLLVLAAIVG